MAERGFDLGRGERSEGGGLRPVDRVAERGYFAGPVAGELPVLDGEERLVFASNNYLGLTADDRVQNAARQAAAAVGTGAGASRLETGDTMVHHDLERALAETLGTERALAFPSRYAAVVGTIAALRPDVVVSDARNGPGVADGCRLAGTTHLEYDHRSASDLRATLEKRDGESRLVVTESTFAADGTVAPIEGICDAAEETGAWVMVDESDAVGLYAGGGGVVQAAGLEDRVRVQVGSLSAALASQGGYVAGNGPLIDRLVEGAPQFAHCAGLAPPAAAAASEALHVSRHGDARDRLWETVAHLRDGLRTMGYEVLGDSQLLPVAIDEPARARELREELYDRGVVAAAVRSPPDGEGRVGLAPMATHDQEDVIDCLEAFRAVGDDLGLV
ncbi:aminotransferase class I/II-fold pyridoxal phosphate-dependent enzyme [Saliphagus sp. LR7]|uniref:aminotransferase class I/II-fold pyridoxal phosphate-dependent enzyme n=1 Tax=Saliphagus sp. LR7 TaxID=2282654 RepID=UPI000DF82019|nr:aminotransferase class I/II-fold pyridoxal phosphate-dependent enzyme [Saliphagus sp. LR7]